MRKRTKSLDVDGIAEAPKAASSLQRGLDILRTFGPYDRSLGNQDLIDRTGLPKATISRLTQTLVALQYLVYDENLGRYSIGPATISLGYSGLSSSAVVRMASPLMQQLANESGAAVALGAREGPDMVYLANCRSNSPVSLQLNPGSRLPIWRTAMGMAYFAEMEEGARNQVLERMIADDPDNASQIRQRTQEAIENYAEYGFVSSFGHWYSYINAVGVAFRPRDGSRLVALTCGGIVDILPPEKCLAEVGPALLRLTRRLEALLSGDEDPESAHVINWNARGV